MRKYLYLIKTNLSQIGAYRTELLFTWVYRLFQMFIVFALWSITQKTEQEIHKLFIYFALAYLIFDIFCSGKIARQISKDIRRGELNAYLIKPFNYVLSVWIKIGVQVLSRLIIPIIIFILLTIIRPDIAAPSSILNLLLFLVTTFLCIILWNLSMTLIGAASFWIYEISQLQNVINLMLNVVIGKIIPVYLFSKEVQDIISWTPANYFGNFQILIYQGQLSQQEIIKGIVILILWILIFFILSKYLYQKGVKIYEASGN